MNLDILSPEFNELAREARILYETKEEKTEAFRKVWMKHKTEMSQLEEKAATLKKKYEAALKSNEKKKEEEVSEKN